MNRDRKGLPRSFSSKESACQFRRHRSHPWVGKAPWRRHGKPLQYSCLENPWTGESGGLTESNTTYRPNDDRDGKGR